MISALFNFVKETSSGDGGHSKAIGPDFIMDHVKDHHLWDFHPFGFDLSITKHILMMWIASAIMILLFSTIFRKPKMVPKGLANFFEFIIVYLQNEVMKPYLGQDSKKYAPYLLTAFFFVLFCSLLGLVPGSATATGDISVTAALALLTFIMVQAAGIKSHGVIGYCKSLIPPGVPAFILPVIIPVEIIGLFTKHISLAIRLFANMFAGHVVIFALLFIIFMFKTWIVGSITLFGLLFVSLLEILIASIQAYIFCILSSVFIGMAASHEH